MRRLIASFLIALSSFALFFTPVAAADQTDGVPCFCRYKDGNPLIDAEEKTFCAGEVGFINFVEDSFLADSRCTEVCAANGGLESVGSSDLSTTGYGRRGNMARDEKELCVFSHFDNNHLTGQSMQIDGWTSDYANCKKPLNSIGGGIPEACSFCYCKYKAGTGTNGACGGKTVYMHATGAEASCPVFCGKFGLDADGPAVPDYADKCDYKTTDSCATAVNAGQGNCKNKLDNAELMEQRVTGSGSVVTLPLPLSDISIPGIIGRVINGLIGVVGAIALLMFVWGGLQWMLAAGDSAKVGKAKQTLTWAALGLVAIFSSYAVLSFVINALK